MQKSLIRKYQERSLKVDDQSITLVTQTKAKTFFLENIQSIRSPARLSFLTKRHGQYSVKFQLDEKEPVTIDPDEFLNSDILVESLTRIHRARFQKAIQEDLDVVSQSYTFHIPTANLLMIALGALIANVLSDAIRKNDYTIIFLSVALIGTALISLQFLLSPITLTKDEIYYRKWFRKRKLPLREIKRLSLIHNYNFKGQITSETLTINLSEKEELMIDSTCRDYYLFRDALIARCPDKILISDSPQVRYPAFDQPYDENPKLPSPAHEEKPSPRETDETTINAEA